MPFGFVGNLTLTISETSLSFESENGGDDGYAGNAFTGTRLLAIIALLRPFLDSPGRCLDMAGGRV
jgi:hypothetical protein